MGPARTRAGWRRWRSGQSASQGPDPHPCRRRKPSLGHLGAGGRQGLGRTQPELCWSAGVGVACSAHGGVPTARSLLPALWTLHGPQSPTPSPLRTASAYQTPTSRPQMEPMSSGRRCLQRGRASVLSFCAQREHSHCGFEDRLTHVQ